MQTTETTETPEVTEDTVIATMRLDYVDGDRETIEQTVGGTYEVREGVLSCISASRRHIIQVPLTALVRWETTAVDNIDELEAASQAQEKRRELERRQGQGMRARR